MSTFLTTIGTARRGAEILRGWRAIRGSRRASIRRSYAGTREANHACDWMAPVWSFDHFMREVVPRVRQNFKMVA